jgi:hypothetical protein
VVTAPQLPPTDGDAGNGGVASPRDEKEPSLALPAVRRAKFAGAGSGIAADAVDGTKAAAGKRTVAAAAGSGASAAATGPAGKVLARAPATDNGGVFTQADVDTLTAPGGAADEEADKEEAAADEQQDEDKPLTGAQQQRPVAPAGRDTSASLPAAGNAPRRQAPVPNAATAAKHADGGGLLGRTRGGAAAGKLSPGLLGGAGARARGPANEEDLEAPAPPKAGSALSAGDGDKDEGTDVEGGGDGEPENGA